MDKNVAERWLTRIEEEVGENGLDSDPHIQPCSNQGIGGGGERRSRQTRDAEAAEARNLPALPRSGGFLEPARVYMPCSDCGQGQLATALATALATNSSGGQMRAVSSVSRRPRRGDGSGDGSRGGGNASPCQSRQQLHREPTRR